MLNQRTGPQEGYALCTQAEGKSVRTIERITSSSNHFVGFPRKGEDVSAITANDLTGIKTVVLTNTSNFPESVLNYRYDIPVSY